MSASKRRAWVVLGVSIGILIGSLVLSVVQGEPFAIGFLLALYGIVVGGLLLHGRYTQSIQRAAPLAWYAAVWIIFTVLRAYADDVGMPNMGDFAAAVDRFVGAGTLPTERLQFAFFVPGSIGILDRITTLIHGSYFLAPHVVAVVFWRTSLKHGSHHFSIYLHATTAVLTLGLLLYILVPTSPPWLQSISDAGAGVTRIIHANTMTPGTSEAQMYALITDPNPVAAMPSLHTAITVLLPLVVWQYNRRVAQALAVYAVAMGASLVYLGEHFVVDVAAGTVLAMVVVCILQRVSTAAEHPFARLRSSVSIEPVKSAPTQVNLPHTTTFTGSDSSTYE